MKHGGLSILFFCASFLALTLSRPLPLPMNETALNSGKGSYNQDSGEGSYNQIPYLLLAGENQLPSKVRKIIKTNTPKIREACNIRMELLESAKKLLDEGKAPSVLFSDDLEDVRNNYRSAIYKFQDANFANSIKYPYRHLQNKMEKHKDDYNLKPHFQNHLQDLDTTLQWTLENSFPHKHITEPQYPLTLSEQEVRQAKAFVDEQHAQAQDLLNKYPIVKPSLKEKVINKTKKVLHLG